MKRLAIVTDDNACFTPDEAKRNKDLFILKMPTIIDGETYFENVNLDRDFFFDSIEKGRDVKTSQPIMGDVVSLREELLKDYEYVIHIPMSSSLSNCAYVLNALSREFNGKVFVIDNHRISVTLKASVYDALTLKDKGLEPEEIVKRLTDNGQNSAAFIMLDSIKQLKKGGRVTEAGSQLQANMHIKPIFEIMGGKLDAYGNAVGIKKAIALIVKATKDWIKNTYKGNIDELQFDLSYTSSKEFAEECAREFEEGLGVKITNIEFESLSIAAHIGKNTIGFGISKLDR